MKKFEFKQSFEDIEIAGQTYRVDLSDEKVTEYQKSFRKFYDESKKLSDVDVESLSDDEQADILRKQKENMKSVTESVLGEGTFDKLYELSGKSTVNYMELLLFITDVFEEKTNNLKEDARKKYVKK